MIGFWALLGLSVAYVGVLFAVAWWGDRRAPLSAWPRLRPAVYALTLAVYCTSWTFFGAVGVAADRGWAYLPIYLGPVLLMAFGWGLLHRLVLISREQGIVSIADFVASRYGKSRALGATVAVIALFVVIPYIALQLQAVVMGFGLLAPASAEGALPDTALLVALLMALFSIAFGTRRLDATEHHRGMMLAVALESLVKLLAFVAVGLFALFAVLGLGGFIEMFRPGQPASAAFFTGSLPTGFVVQTLLAFAAIFCLPRQFHVAVVECEDPKDLHRARLWFPLYLLAFSVFVVPIAVAGVHVGLQGGADAYVLTLPLAFDQRALTLFAFIGGFSAATGMVIVSSMALAVMLSNEVVMPALMRIRRLGLDQRRDLGWLALWVRRICILAAVLLAYGYFRLISGYQALAEIGLLAFAAAVQFAPAIIGGLYWRGASRRGVLGGLLGGFLLWFWCLLLPTLALVLPGLGSIVSEGPLGIGWLRPQALFNLSGWDPLTHGVFWSLLVNVGLFLILSLRWRPSFAERLQATPFLDPFAQRPFSAEPIWMGNATVADLTGLAGRIVGESACQRAFAEFAEQQGIALYPHRLADRGLVQFTERLLAGSIGAASARLMLTTTLRGAGMELGEVVSLLDETSQELKFNRELLQATMDNVSQGISVVDAQMRLVAWNRRYLEIFEYPEGMVYVGRPIADLIRYNAQRGECGPGDVEEHVAKRLRFMQQGSPHVFERRRPNGQVIEMRGLPMPGGGFVTTFSDVTDYKRNEEALRIANETLEQRVEQRTRELSAALEAQRQAKQEAEQANLSKTRFLAAASHDLLQPLNAARLFVSALRHETEASPELAALVQRVDVSLNGAEELLSALLDISKLDAGAVAPDWCAVSLGTLFESLRTQFARQAEVKDIQLRFVATGVFVRSDKLLMRRILQNFVSNAIRYTPNGGRVLVGCRRRGRRISVEVHDTGLGIPLNQQKLIFEEFRRLRDHEPGTEKGLGLGLAICERIARMLGHELAVVSEPGRGSVFSINAPRSEPGPISPSRRSSVEFEPSSQPQRVLCIDNEPQVLDGMQALLERWGLEVRTCTGADQAIELLAEWQPDVLLADYHLDEGDPTGLELLTRVADLWPDLPCALITADHGEELRARTRAAGIPVLRKPVRPAALRSLLASLPRRESLRDSVVP